VVLQNEDDLVARWWPEGRGSEWLVQQAVEHAARRGLLVRVKQHPYDPKAPSDYDVDPSRVRFLGKDAIPYPDLPKANDALLAGATEVWGFNSTMLTEAALIHGVPTRAFGPTLMDGHGILAQEAPFVPSAADSTPSLGADERRLAFLRRVLARQVSADHVAEAESSIRASQELANRWDVVLARDART
jgi:hypothetical protein